MPFKLSHGLEEFQYEYGDECGPYLYHYRILRSTDKSLDFEQLFDLSKEYLNLPPASIKLTDRICYPRHLISDQFNSLLVFLIPNGNPSKPVCILLFGAVVFKFDYFVYQDVLISIIRQIIFFYFDALEVLFMPNDEKYLVAVPNLE